MRRIMGIGMRGAMALALLTAATTAEGIVVKNDAMVLHGSASNCTKPASIDMKRVEKETDEYKTIKSDGVRKGSARYEILIAKMHRRIKRACKEAADASGHDCVVRERDVKDSRGLEVKDLTQEVIDELDDVSPE